MPPKSALPNKQVMVDWVNQFKLSDKRQQKFDEACKKKKEDIGVVYLELKAIEDDLVPKDPW